MKNHGFREKVEDASKRVLIYEVVPPEPHTTVKALRRSAATLCFTLKGFENVDAIYIPEVTDESERGEKIARHAKVPARRFAAFVKSNHPEKDLIITQPFSYLPKNGAEDWLVETSGKYGIKNIVVVGPSHRKLKLPGYSVVETADLIRKLNRKRKTDIFPGGIAIDTRENEAQRMVEKAKHGIGYFTTQLFYTADGMIKLLGEYAAESEKQRVVPRRVFLSVSPISSASTAKVIENLIERKIDEGLKTYLFSKDGGIGNRSIQRIEEMFTRLFDHCYGEHASVPLGICVEHITDSNFKYALELVYSLGELWKDYLPDSELPTGENGF